MALDHYVTLGHSGLRVSPLCLGAMTFGMDWGWGSTPEESVAIVDAYLGKGGNFIDTANAYTKGHSEKILGDHIGKHPSKRDRIVLATKFLSNMYRGDPNGGGSHRKAVVQQLENSLRRLQTSYVDLYWMHAWDATTPIEETMRALDDLVRDGKVRYIGFSDTPAWKCAEAQTIARFRGWSPLVALQIEHSLLERTVEGELMPMARELGLGVTPWSPLKGGALSGKYKRDNKGSVESGRAARVESGLDERAWAVLDVAEGIAKERSTTMSRVALAWVRQRPGVTSTILGARTMAQLEDNLASLEVTLTDAEIAKLDAVSKPKLNFPAEFIANGAFFVQNGATVNGRASGVWPMSPANDAERW